MRCSSYLYTAATHCARATADPVAVQTINNHQYPVFRHTYIIANECTTHTRMYIIIVPNIMLYIICRVYV